MIIKRMKKYLFLLLILTTTFCQSQVKFTLTLTDAVTQEQFNDSIAKYALQILRLQKQLDSLQIAPPPALFYKNAPQTANAMCPLGYTGDQVSYTVVAGFFTSTLSQKDADTLAYSFAQRAAASQLKCQPPPNSTYRNTLQSYTATCPSATTGNPVSVSILGGTVTSTISQVDADTIALRQAIISARSGLVCTPIIITPPSAAGTFYNTFQTYTATAPAGYTSDAVTWTCQPNQFLSANSVDSANATAMLWCEKMAKATVWRNMEMITPYIKNGFNASVTKGSMIAGSNVVTLKNNIHANVGDYLIVNPKTVRGQKGLEGQWPQTYYTTIAEMNADNSKPEGMSYAGNLQDGLAYRYQVNDSGIYRWYPFTHTPYHLEKIIPYSIENAKILSVSSDGLTLTIDKTAHISVTDAQVCFDHTPLVQKMMDDGIADIVIPPGKFRFGRILYANKFSTVTFKGSGEDATFLQSPEGCMPMSIQLVSLWQPNRDHRAVVSDLTMIQNAGADGFRFDQAEDDGITLDITPGTNGLLYSPFVKTQAIEMGSWNGTVERVRIIDPLSYAVQQSSPNCKILNCEALITVPILGYNGFTFHSQGDESSNGDSSYSEMSNNLIVSNHMTTGYETFRTQNTKVINNRSINAGSSINSCSGITWSNYRFNNCSNAYSGSFNRGNPALAVVSYFSGSSFNEILNTTIETMPMPFTQLQADTLATIIYRIGGIYGGANTNNVEVDGAVIASPNSDNDAASVGIHLQGTNFHINHVKVIGKLGSAYYDYPELYFVQSSISVDGAGLIENTEASVIRTINGCKVDVTTVKADLIHQ